MPFVDADIIEPFIHSAINKKLQADSDLFDIYENQAACFIRDTTGEDIPTDTDDRPDWVDSVAAAIIEWLAMTSISGLSENETKRIKDRYDRAVKEMSKYRTAPTTAKNSFIKTGSYEQEEW